VGSHPSACAASSGLIVARSLKPASARLPEQKGQPSPLARRFVGALQLWPRLHFQFRLVLDPGRTVVGSHPSACAASSGLIVARSLKPASARLPEQKGQPKFFAVISPTAHCHVWPWLQIQSNFFLLCDETVEGSQPFAIAATRGENSARVFRLLKVLNSQHS
jgi:hypothetical protein